MKGSKRTPEGDFSGVSEARAGEGCLLATAKPVKQTTKKPIHATFFCLDNDLLILISLSWGPYDRGMLSRKLKERVRSACPCIHAF